MLHRAMWSRENAANISQKLYEVNELKTKGISRAWSGVLSFHQVREGIDRCFALLVSDRGKSPGLEIAKFNNEKEKI